MKLDLNAPALLFPAISLLLLAYTNRFLAIANLVRTLHRNYQETKEEHLVIQIKSLRRRLLLIRNMQVLGVMSIFFCIFSMLMIFSDSHLLGKYFFGMSMILMMSSLFFSVWELLMSIHALDVELSDMAEKKQVKKHKNTD